MTDLYRLAYKPDAHHGRFTHIRYPHTHGVPLETALRMREAMPDPDHFNIIKDGD